MQIIAYFVSILCVLLLNGCVSPEINEGNSLNPRIDSDKVHHRATPSADSILSIEEEEIEIAEGNRFETRGEIGTPKKNYEEIFEEPPAINSLHPESTQDSHSGKELSAYESLPSQEKMDLDPPVIISPNTETAKLEDKRIPEIKDSNRMKGGSEGPPFLNSDKENSDNFGHGDPPDSITNAIDLGNEEIRNSELVEQEIVGQETEESNVKFEVAKLSDNLKEKIVEELPTPTPPTLKPPRSIDYGSVSGKVSILRKGKSISPENVMIVVKAMGDQIIQERPPRTHTIQMQGKKFLPRYRIIKKGDTIIFKNIDPFMHNVFSLAGSNKFDLGTYGKGTLPEHTFEYEGIVKVYCNIHPTMASFIMVSRNDWGLITGKDGAFEFESLPAGEYELTAWSIRGQFSETIEIEADQMLSFDIQIQSSNFRKKQHPNKFGKKYPKKSFDEFYQ